MLEKKACKDHLGNEYASLEEMCAAYSIARSLFDTRVRRGWSLQDALTLEKQHGGSNGKICKDHLGKEYKSISEMCMAYGIAENLYSYRVNAGWGKERALTKKKYTDHLGKEYKSVSEMCRAYGIEQNLYSYRMNAGWGKEDALTKKRQGVSIYG